MNQKNILFVISHFNSSPSIELDILGIRTGRYHPICCLFSHEETLFEKNLKDAGITCIRIPYSGKISAFSIFYNLCCLILKYKPEIVHCHLLWAGMLGLSAAVVCGVPKRIITRHYSDMHHIYYPKGVWYDWYCNKLATKIIATSENSLESLIDLEKVSQDKIKLIEYSYDFSIYDNIKKERVQSLLNKYNPDKRTPVIGVVSRFVSWKGIHYIIPAFQRVLDLFPNAILVLAGTEGDYSVELHQMLKSLPDNSYICINFEKDILALYKTFDVFVHTPVSKTVESAGSAFLEGLMSGVPCVFTLSGVANYFVEHRKNAYVVNYKNEDDIYNGIIACLNGFMKSKNIENTQEYIRNHFGHNTKVEQLLNLYAEPNK